MFDNILRLVCLCLQILLWNLGTRIDFRVERNCGCFYFAFSSQLSWWMCLYYLIINGMSWFYKLAEIYWRKAINILSFIRLIKHGYVFWVFDLFDWSLRSCNINIFCKILLEMVRLLTVKIVGRKLVIPVCFYILRQTWVILNWDKVIIRWWHWFIYGLILLQTHWLKRSNFLVFYKTWS